MLSDEFLLKVQWAELLSDTPDKTSVLEPDDQATRIGILADMNSIPFDPRMGGYLTFERGGQHVQSRVERVFQIGASVCCDLRLDSNRPSKVALVVHA